MNDCKRPSVLTIAGTDPSGGAGIQADIKAISATGSYAMSVITALVAQNTQGVQNIEPVRSEFVKQQLFSVYSDMSIHATKIGMLHNEGIMQIVMEFLTTGLAKHVVIDPVMVAKHGEHLVDKNAIAFLTRTIIPFATLITPNLPEAEVLLDDTIHPTEMEQAARHLGNTLQINVLIKGGHAEGLEASDVLYLNQEQQIFWFKTPRINTKNTHGTGCTLSSAIASYLAQNLPLIDAVRSAKRYITHAIQGGSTQQFGHGQGPVDHFFFIDGKTNEHFRINS